MNKAVFLDRDGVVNREIGDYIKKLEEFSMLPHAVKYISELHQHGFLVFIITNQGGIAKGLYTVEELDRMHETMHREVNEAGGKISEVYYCPHHPDFGACLCRKPGSLMAEKAVARYHVDPKQSVFIGDKVRDVECAEGAGIKGFLISENEDWGPIIASLITGQRQSF
jgi:D-glycero-D-manno-heptose 1,7-bisphosphate phosphatase